MKSLDKKNKWVPSLVLNKEVRPQKMLLAKRTGHVPRFMVSRVEKKKRPAI